jgi:hypothetical protein
MRQSRFDFDQQAADLDDALDGLFAQAFDFVAGVLDELPVVSAQLAIVKVGRGNVIHGFFCRSRSCCSLNRRKPSWTSSAIAADSDGILPRTFRTWRRNCSTSSICSLVSRMLFRTPLVGSIATTFMLAHSAELCLTI